MAFSALVSQLILVASLALGHEHRAAHYHVSHGWFAIGCARRSTNAGSQCRNTGMRRRYTRKDVPLASRKHRTMTTSRAVSEDGMLCALTVNYFIRAPHSGQSPSSLRRFALLSAAMFLHNGPTVAPDLDLSVSILQPYQLPFPSPTSTLPKQ